MEWEELISEKNLGVSDASELAELIAFDHGIGDLDFRLNLLIAIFTKQPSYFTSNYFKILYPEFDTKQKSKLWDFLSDQLQNDNITIKHEVEYLLWVDFFVDKNTVVEAWNNILKRSSSESVIASLLVASGPVPFDLKYELYSILVNDVFWHKLILKSINASIYDVYGKVEIELAKEIFVQLNVDESNDMYQAVRRRLIDYEKP